MSLDPVAGLARETPLDWLHRRKDKSGRALIGAEQFAAGVRLAADFEAAGRGPRTTMSWDDQPRGGLAQRADAASDARDRAFLARSRLDRALMAVGPDFADILVEVCCLGTGLEQIERRAGWPNRSAKLVLQLALNALARHYGLLPPMTPRTAPFAPTAARHWGTADYRPRIGGG